MHRQAAKDSIREASPELRFPSGTAAGLYPLWALTHKETEPLLGTGKKAQRSWPDCFESSLSTINREPATA